RACDRTTMNLATGPRDASAQSASSGAAGEIDYPPSMSLTPSTMLPLGTPAPDFSLPDTLGNTVSLRDFEGAPALVVVFICNHCPYVVHVRSALAQLGRDLDTRGVAMVAISASDAVKYPADGPEAMATEAREAGYTFPYLYDESQAVARAYAAACTPDTYVFDREQKLVYRGQLDGARPGNAISPDCKDVRDA